MRIRKYKKSDCNYLIELFYDTVHSINAKDYTKEQLDVWATKSINWEEWDQSLSAHFTVVAVDEEIIVGFGDITQNGYLDRLYVHKAYLNRGIATAICDELEKRFNVSTICTHASITAKPFFEKRGYQVVKKQEIERQGIALTNYVMEKSMHLIGDKRKVL